MGKSSIFVNPNPDGWGIYSRTPETLNRYNSTTPKVTTVFEINVISLHHHPLPGHFPLK
jgi:hypothetical protein